MAMSVTTSIWLKFQPGDENRPTSPNTGPPAPENDRPGVAGDGSEAFVLKARRAAGVARVPVPVPGDKAAWRSVPLRPES